MNGNFAPSIGTTFIMSSCSFALCGMFSHQEKLINFSHNVPWQTENPSRSQSNELKGNERPTEVPWAVKNEPRPADQKRTTNERRATKPDHEAYPSLPGTPEPYISEFENVTKQPKRKSPPPDLTTEKPQKEVQIVWLSSMFLTITLQYYSIG